MCFELFYMYWIFTIILEIKRFSVVGFFFNTLGGVVGGIIFGIVLKRKNKRMKIIWECNVFMQEYKGERIDDKVGWLSGKACKSAIA